MVSKMVYTTILHALRLMKFLSVRKGATGSHSRPLNNKKKGGPLPKVYKRASPQAFKLDNETISPIVGFYKIKQKRII